jgi:hypothetical protein
MHGSGTRQNSPSTNKTTTTTTTTATIKKMNSSQCEQYFREGRCFQCGQTGHRANNLSFHPDYRPNNRRRLGQVHQDGLQGQQAQARVLEGGEGSLEAGEEVDSGEREAEENNGAGSIRRLCEEVERIQEGRTGGGGLRPQGGHTDPTSPQYRRGLGPQARGGVDDGRRSPDSELRNKRDVERELGRATRLGETRGQMDGGNGEGLRDDQRMGQGVGGGRSLHTGPVPGQSLEKRSPQTFESLADIKKLVSRLPAAQLGQLVDSLDSVVEKMDF